MDGGRIFNTGSGAANVSDQPRRVLRPAPDSTRLPRRARAPLIVGEITKVSYKRLPRIIRCGVTFPLEGSINFRIEPKAGVKVKLRIELFIGGKSIGAKNVDGNPDAGVAWFEGFSMECRELRNGRCAFKPGAVGRGKLTAKVTWRANGVPLTPKSFDGPVVWCIKNSGFLVVELDAPKEIDCPGKAKVHVTAHYLFFDEDADWLQDAKFRVWLIASKFTGGRNGWRWRDAAQITIADGDKETGTVSVEAKTLTVTVECSDSCDLSIGGDPYGKSTRIQGIATVILAGKPQKNGQSKEQWIGCVE